MVFLAWAEPSCRSYRLGPEDRGWWDRVMDICLSSSSSWAWVCSHGRGKGSQSGKEKVMRSSLETAQRPFYHILSAKASHKVSSDAKGSKTGSIITAFNGRSSVTFWKAWIQRGVASYRHFCNLPHPVFEWKKLVRERKMNRKGNKKCPIYVLMVVGKDT